MTPSEVSLPDFFKAFERPCCFKISSALATSPLDSSRAFLAAITPAPVFSLNSLTLVTSISIKNSEFIFLTLIVPYFLMLRLQFFHYIFAYP